MDVATAMKRLEHLEEKVENYEQGNAVLFHADDLVLVVKLLQREQNIVNYLYEALGPANDEILDMAYEDVGDEI